MKDHRLTNPATQMVVAEIHNERLRQINTLGFTAATDDIHEDGELAQASCCLAAPDPIFILSRSGTRFHFEDAWPSGINGDKRPRAFDGSIRLLALTTHTRRRSLIKAAALLVAEIERIDRAKAKVAP